MWYLVKYFLKVQIDKICRFTVVCVICVYNLGKEIEQACQAATIVLDAKLRVSYQLGCSFPSVISLPLTNLPMVLQTREVRLMGL